MPLDTHTHTLIDRPKGLSGYAPAKWCAVCGATAVKKQIVSCLSPDCPNVCHKHCLIDLQAAFDCGTVEELRRHQQIPDHVTYSNTHTQESPNTSTQLPTTEEEELLNLDSEELVKIIQNLRKENRRYKLTLSYFDRSSKDIAKNRDAVVTVLNFIDNIAATQISLNNLAVNSRPTTARDSNIDKDWQKHLTKNKETRDWWLSDKPRRLQKQNHLHTGTQVQSPHTHCISTQTTASNSQTLTLNTDTLVPSPDTQTPKSNLRTPAQNTGTQTHSSDTCYKSTQTQTPNNQPPSLTATNNLNTNTPQTQPLVQTSTNTHNYQKTPNANTELKLPPPIKIGGTPATFPRATNTNKHPQPLKDTRPKPSTKTQASKLTTTSTNNVSCQTLSPTDNQVSVRPKTTQNQKQDKPPKRNKQNSTQTTLSNTLNTKNKDNPRANHNTRRPPPLLPTPSHIPQDNQQKTRKYCYYCNRYGHTDNICRWLTWCYHCNREGHTVQNCRSLQTQKKNQTLSYQLTELIDTLNRHFNKSTSLTNPPALLSNSLATQQTYKSKRQSHAEKH